MQKVSCLTEITNELRMVSDIVKRGNYFILRVLWLKNIINAHGKIIQRASLIISKETTVTNFLHISSEVVYVLKKIPLFLWMYILSTLSLLSLNSNIHNVLNFAFSLSHMPWRSFYISTHKFIYLTSYIDYNLSISLQIDI